MSYQNDKELIMKRIAPWTFNKAEAEKWFYEEYLPALGCTADDALRNGHLDALLKYLCIFEKGGYA